MNDDLPNLDAGVPPTLEETVRNFTHGMLRSAEAGSVEWWLQSALNCPLFPWDADQHECATLALQARKRELAAPKHDLYKTGDAGAPDAIKDRNGGVALDLCKVCGQGEVELEETCPGKPVAWDADFLAWMNHDDGNEAGMTIADAVGDPAIGHWMQAAWRAALASKDAGGKTGWPAGMLQDDSHELSKALSETPDARLQAREAAEAVRVCPEKDAECGRPENACSGCPEQARTLLMRGFKALSPEAQDRIMKIRVPKPTPEERAAQAEALQRVHSTTFTSAAPNAAQPLVPSPTVTVQIGGVRLAEKVSEVDRGRWKVTPLAARPECCNRGNPAGECCGGTGCWHDDEAARARASWAAFDAARADETGKQ